MLQKRSLLVGIVVVVVVVAAALIVGLGRSSEEHDGKGDPDKDVALIGVVGQLRLEVEEAG